MRRALVSGGLVAASSVLSVHVAQAQQRPSVEPGQRVRVTVDCAAEALATSAAASIRCPPEGRLTGRLVELPGDSVALEVDGSTARYPVEAVTLLEASRGSRSHLGAGALVGFVAGTTVTFLVLDSGSPASTNACDPDNNQDAIGGTGTCLLLAGAVGGLPGALVGAVVGSLLRTEEWEPVPLAGVGVTPFPRGGGAALAVSVPLG